MISSNTAWILSTFIATETARLYATVCLNSSPVILTACVLTIWWSRRPKSSQCYRRTGFYPELLTHLLKLVLPIELDGGEAEKVIVITDTIPVNKKRRAIERGVRTALHGTLPPGMKYRILHHQSRSHYGLQVADYCCWAIFRKWQTGESTWYDRIKPAIRRELDLFHTKSTYYY